MRYRTWGLLTPLVDPSASGALWQLLFWRDGTIKICVTAVLLKVGRYGVRNRVVAKGFATPVQKNSVFHPASCTVDTSAVSQGYRGRCVPLTTHHCWEWVELYPYSSLPSWQVSGRRPYRTITRGWCWHQNCLWLPFKEDIVLAAEGG